jgi:hypothetical protein
VSKVSLLALWKRRPVSRVKAATFSCYSDVDIMSKLEKIICSLYPIQQLIKARKQKRTFCRKVMGSCGFM